MIQFIIWFSITYFLDNISFAIAELPYNQKDDCYEKELNHWTQKTALKLLLSLFPAYSPTKEEAAKIYEILLEKMKAVIVCGRVEIQPALMDALCKIGILFRKIHDLDENRKQNFVIALKLAISLRSNRSCLSYWINFLMIEIPMMELSFPHILLLLQQFSKEFNKFHWTSNQSHEGILTPDSECSLLLHGFEWIIRYLLHDNKIDHYADSNWSFPVWSSENKNELTLIIPYLTLVLVRLYDSICKSQIESIILEPVLRRVTAIVNVIYKKYPLLIIESVVQGISSEKAYQFLLRIEKMEPTTVSNEIIRALKNRATDNSERIASESKLLSVLQFSIKNRTGTPEFSNFSTFINSKTQSTSNKAIFIKIIQVLDTFFQSGVFQNDPRTMKEAEDLFCKVLDYNVLIIASKFDQGIWKKVTILEDEFLKHPGLIKKELLVEYGLSEDSFLYSEELKEGLIVSDLLKYFYEVIIDNLKAYISSDKYLPVITNFLNLVCIPCLKKTSGSPFTEVVIKIMNKMANLNAVSLWKKDVFEWYCDSKFFMVPSKQFRSLIQTLFVNDSEKFAEILTKREYGTTQQYMNLRKISFVIISSANNFYRPNLPQLQEKISEMLKSNNLVLRGEALFVIICLFFKIDSALMQSYWPTILHQFLDIFTLKAFKTDSIPVKRGDIHLLHQSCILLVLIDALGIDAFQWNKWIFFNRGDGLADILLENLKTHGEPYVEICQILARKWNTKEKLEQYVETIFDRPIRE